MTTGILFALAAMFFWGFGDFLIQRSTRKFGNWETLFLISFVGVAILLPLVVEDIVDLFSAGDPPLLLLFGASAILFVAAIMEFEALRRGKIFVVEPTWSLEIPVSAVLAFVILDESLTAVQSLLIGALIVGLFLISYKGKVFSKKFFLEKGIVISSVSAVFMGGANFFVGWAARETDPLFINFVISLFCMVGSAAVLYGRGRLGRTLETFREYPKLILPMCILDNFAWIAFAFAMTLAPIGIAAAISESYIAIAVLLGLFIGKEKLERHQKRGLVLALAAAVILASQTL